MLAACIVAAKTLGFTEMLMLWVETLSYGPSHVGSVIWSCRNGHSLFQLPCCLPVRLATGGTGSSCSGGPRDQWFCLQCCCEPRGSSKNDATPSQAGWVLPYYVCVYMHCLLCMLQPELGPSPPTTWQTCPACSCLLWSLSELDHDDGSSSDDEVSELELMWCF